ncbi:MAG: hypothetical protein KDJ67_12630 [Nitratireductor sp.]|nr:hypothetical protein [Nitratireductor sp.]
MTSSAIASEIIDVPGRNVAKTDNNIKIIRSWRNELFPDLAAIQHFFGFRPYKAAIIQQIYVFRHSGFQLFNGCIRLNSDQFQAGF